MSLLSWKKEFYPVPAGHVEPTAAATHSLIKWIGLREENLQRHGLTVGNNADIRDRAKTLLYIDDTSCALCANFFDDEADFDKVCANCPLAIVRGGAACTDIKDSETISPYEAWASNPDGADPEPMIGWLEKIVSPPQSQVPSTLTYVEVLEDKLREVVAHAKNGTLNDALLSSIQKVLSHQPRKETP